MAERKMKVVGYHRNKGTEYVYYKEFRHPPAYKLVDVVEVSTQRGWPTKWLINRSDFISSKKQ